MLLEKVEVHGMTSAGQLDQMKVSFFVVTGIMDNDLQQSALTGEIDILP